MLKLIKNLLQGFGVFVGSFLLIHIIASSFYAVGPDGYLQAQNSYPIILLLISAVLTFLSFKITPDLTSKKKINPIKRIREKERLESMSDVEKWQLEQTAHEATSNESFSVPTQTAIEVEAIVDQAAAVIFETGEASISMLQQKLNLGYATAAHIIDQLEAVGVVGDFSGSAPRRILMSQTTYERSKRIIAQSMRVTPTQKFSDANEFSKYGGIDAELLTVDLMDGHDFEYWCANLLRKLDFTNVDVTPGSGDQGVDILAQKEGIKYAIQCKCYSSDLGNTPIQEVHAGKAMYHCQVGTVMTNRYFTAGGKQLAEATGVLLWDRDWIRNALETTFKMHTR